MTIHPIGANRVALTLTSAELSSYGFSPVSLTLEQALALTKEACAQEGIILEGLVELEIYPGQWDVMLFAHSPAAMPPRPIPRRPLRRRRVRREPT